MHKQLREPLLLHLSLGSCRPWQAISRYVDKEELARTSSRCNKRRQFLAVVSSSPKLIKAIAASSFSFVRGKLFRVFSKNLRALSPNRTRASRRASSRKKSLWPKAWKRGGMAIGLPLSPKQSAALGGGG